MFTFRKRGFRPSRRTELTTFRPRLEALDDRCLPSGGVLDPTFGSGGIVSTNVGGLNRSFAVATYPSAGTANDGKVVAVGEADITQGKNSYPEFAVARFNLDGTLDTTFGSGHNGEVTTILTSVQQGGIARDVAIQPDGKIVVAGYSFNGDFALVRYNANGSLDTSFGANGTGVVLTSVVKNSTDQAYSLGLQSDGKIVVAGVIFGSSNLALVRYTAGGLLDSSFGAGGKLTSQFAVNLGSGSVNWVDLALDTSPLDPNAGKIVVVTRVANQTEVVRYNTGGSLDASFGGGAGYETLSNLRASPSVAIQSNGDIIVAGLDASLGIGLDRLNPDGSFDATFGSGGIVVADPPANTSYSPRDVTIQSNGQIVVAGFYSTTTQIGQSFLVARFNSADGSLDTSFGTGGIASSGTNNVTDTVGVALEPDGRIVVVGTIVNTGGFTLARFVAAGPSVGSFTASPNPVTAGSDLTLTASNITDANPGATVTQATFYVDSNGDGVLDSGDTLLGYGTQISLGVWTYTFTVNLAPGTYTLFAQAEDSYGVFGDPFATSVQVI
jgi:uncharacterized delta-60 repeat protein